MYRLILACLLCLAGIFLSGIALADSSPRPGLYLIPNVKKQTPFPGRFGLAISTRIVLDPHYSTALASTGQIFAADLKAITGHSVPVVSSTPRPGDILLTLGSRNKMIDGEGYVMSIGDHVEIRARTDAGVFYGTQTLLQYLKQTSSLTGTVIVDWPDYPMRGLMVDVGRKYFSVQWLENEIRDLSYLKLNTLHLHLSDDKGFRIQSESHPELNAGALPLYSKAQIRQLVDFAKRRHIEIIPEIDLPAHANAILRAHPELRLVDTSGNALPDKIDLSLPQSYKLIDDLLNEYLPLFPGRYWHCGCDEFLHPGEFDNYPQLKAYAVKHWGSNATAIDTFLNYANHVDAIVRGHGKRTRAWCDIYEYLTYTGNAVGLNKDITIELWNRESDPQDVLNHGYNLLNATYQPLYYNVGDGSYNHNQELYENWRPNLHFNTERNRSVAPLAKGLEGAKYHIWCDNSEAEAEDQVAADINDALNCLAQNCWGASKFVPTYDKFQPIIRVIGHSPALR